MNPHRLSMTRRDFSSSPAHPPSYLPVCSAPPARRCPEARPKMCRTPLTSDRSQDRDRELPHTTFI
jgi:hypothetical protein